MINASKLILCLMKVFCYIFHIKSAIVVDYFVFLWSY